MFTNRSSLAYYMPPKTEGNEERFTYSGYNLVTTEACEYS